MDLAKAYLFSILDNISDAIYVVNSDMKIMYLNKRAKDICGCDPDDNTMIAGHCHDFSKGRLCACTGSLGETIKNGIEFDNVEIKLENKDSKNIVLRQKTRILHDENGKVAGAIAIFSDITESKVLTQNISDYTHLNNIIGKSYKILQMIESIQQSAPTDATVLVLGETGTGKELVANALHETSKRKDGPLIKVNCSALSENILESELFGHVKGSFTGAIRDKVGKFELANKGTIFLDEIGELNPQIQIKLLRVLQEKEIERVGDNKTIKIDTRIIAATNRNLKEEVKKRNFREDLYFRLHVFPIRVPSLRERPDDIEVLAHSFLDKMCKYHKKELFLPEHIINAFKRYTWPGNVRELENVIEYAVIRAQTNEIQIEDLPEDLLETINTLSSKEELDGIKNSDLKESFLREVLQESGWNKSKASKKLNIGRTTLWRLMKKYNIADPSHQ